MSPKYRLINVIDTVSGLETTIKISRVIIPDDEDITIHQILGTYHKIEDFNYEWDMNPGFIEKKVLCPKCKEPITYSVPNLKDLVNFISLTKTDAMRLINALLGVLK